MIGVDPSTKQQLPSISFLINSAPLPPRNNRFSSVSNFNLPRKRNVEEECGFNGRSKRVYGLPSPESDLENGNLGYFVTTSKTHLMMPQPNIIVTSAGSSQIFPTQSVPSISLVPLLPKSKSFIEKESTFRQTLTPASTFQSNTFQTNEGLFIELPQGIVRMKWEELSDYLQNVIGCDGKLENGNPIRRTVAVQPEIIRGRILRSKTQSSSPPFQKFTRVPKRASRLYEIPNRLIEDDDLALPTFLPSPPTSNRSDNGSISPRVAPASPAFHFLVPNLNYSTSSNGRKLKVSKSTEALLVEGVERKVVTLGERATQWELQKRGLVSHSRVNGGR